MSRSRELARQKAVIDASVFLMTAGTIGDLAQEIVNGLDGLRGESRVGYCIGIINALETLGHREKK